MSQKDPFSRNEKLYLIALFHQDIDNSDMSARKKRLLHDRWKEVQSMLIDERGDAPKVQTAYEPQGDLLEEIATVCTNVDSKLATINLLTKALASGKFPGRHNQLYDVRKKLIERKHLTDADKRVLADMINHT